MSDQDSGYITDVEYTWGYYPEIGPVMLNWIAASAGHSPRPLDREFTYLELGCGNGVTINLNGALHPKGKFYGVDFNAQHVDNAQSMASSGGLGNVRIIRCAFQDFVQGHRDLPKFDFITLQGILTWIATEYQDAIIDIIDKMLLPGGIAYLSYNCYPGQSLIEPVRRIMIEHTKGMQGDSRKKAQAGIGFVEKLLEVKPRAFMHGERVKRLLARMKEASPNYIVHEYFNHHWYPFWFSDIAERFGRAGLSYVGSATLQRNILDLTLNAAQRKVLEPIRDPLRRQQVQDFMLDEQFRRDVFVRAAPVQIPRDPMKVPGLLDLRIGTMRAEREIEREVKTPGATVRFRSQFDDKMLSKLCSGNYSVREYLNDPALSERTPLGIAQVIQLLMATRQAWPMAEAQPVVPADLASRSDLKWEVPSAWNKMVIDQRIAGGNVRNIAAPVAGTGVPLSAAEACILDGLANVGLTGALDHADRALARRKRVLVVGKERIERGEMQTKALRDELELFKQGKLAKFIKLGIIRSAT